MPCLPQFKINPYLLSKIDNMVRFMEDRNLYLTFDTAHCGSMHTDFLGDFHQFYDSGRMRNIHFSDYGNAGARASPITSPDPVSAFATPAGRPASISSSPSLKADSGVCSAGLRTTVLPAARAGATFSAIWCSG